MNSVHGRSAAFTRSWPLRFSPSAERREHLMNAESVSISEADRLAIEASSVVPIVRSYEAELGPERARPIVEELIGDRLPPMVAAFEKQMALTQAERMERLTR